MCKIFYELSSDEFSQVKRSVRIQGHSTSIRLEGFFWEIIDKIAKKEGMNTPQFLNVLYSEIIENQDSFGNEQDDNSMINFASLIRIGCHKYIMTNLN